MPGGKSFFANYILNVYYNSRQRLSLGQWVVTPVFRMPNTFHYKKILAAVFFRISNASHSSKQTFVLWQGQSPWTREVPFL